MNKAKYMKGMLPTAGLLAAMLAAPGLVFGQTMTVGSGAGNAGGTAETEITWEAGPDEDIAEVQIQILYDENVVTPQNDGDDPANVDDCLGSLQSPHADSPFSACLIAEPGRVVVTVHSNFTFDALSSGSIGTITWDIDAGATVPSTVELEAEERDVTDTDGNSDNETPEEHFTAVSGEISIEEVPPEVSVLNVQPESINFGGVQTGTTSGPETVTVSNDGEDGIDLELTSIDVTGDFDIAGGDCAAGTVLADGETCTIDVTFSPSADGPATGSLSVDSDADEVTNDTVSLEGEGTEAPPADLSISPPSGAVNLGSGLQGDTVPATAVRISNAGEQDGSFDCTLTDPDGVFDASPLTGDVPAGGEASVSLSCTLPAEAEDGDSFGATFACTGSEGFSSEHDLSCSVSEFEPLPVPTMQNWSLILFALMMLIAGGIGIRFFRA